MSSKENRKNLLKQAQMQQSLLKIDMLLNDSLAKLNSVLKTFDKDQIKQVVLLTQVANNIEKIQRLMKQYVKTTP
jgi:hypothetical protein